MARADATVRDSHGLRLTGPEPRQPRVLPAAALVAAAALLFAPIAVAASAPAARDAIVATMVVTLAGSVLPALILRAFRRDAAAWQFGLGALTAGLVWVRIAPSIVPAWTTTDGVTGQTTIAAVLVAVAVALLVRGGRELIARPRRIPWLLASVLLALALFPGPMLLLQLDSALEQDSNVNRLALAIRFWIGAAPLIIGAGVIFAGVGGQFIDRTYRAVRDTLVSIPRRWFLLALGAGVAAVAATFGNIAFSHEPTLSDEVAQLWHARILLTGQLSLPADPNPEFFAIDNMIDRGRWYSQFPLGGPVMLAVGQLLNVPWLINPVCAGIGACALSVFAVRAYDEVTGRLAGLFVLMSPVVLLMGGSYMNHVATLMFLSVALAALAVWMSEPEPEANRWRAAAVVGGAIGAAVCIRPLDGAVAAVVIGGWMAWNARRTPVRKRDVAIGLAAAAIPIALLFVANWQTTGSPFLTGYAVLWGTNHGLGFHLDPFGNPHTPWRALLLVIKYVVQLNWSLLEWPIPALLLPITTLLLLPRLSRWDGLLVAWIGIHTLAYALYWHDGEFVGPRYLFSVLPAILLMVVRAPLVIARRAPDPVRRWTLSVVTLCGIAAWAIPLAPFGVLGQLHGVRETRQGFKVDLDAALAPLRDQRALVFIDEPASSKLGRRLWGLGISRSDAARLIDTKEGCALLDGIRVEEQSGASPDGRAQRLRDIRPYTADAKIRIAVADQGFRVSDTTSLSPACRDLLRADARHGLVLAYGPALLRNRIDAEGRITGPLVLVADLGDHNEVLRSRFGDRPWYRLEVARSANDLVPRLAPY
jgi:hypothetical protein